MLISYYVAAVFATIYYIVLAPELCGAFGRRPFGFSFKRYSRFAAGFEESLQGFLDAMLLFASTSTERNIAVLEGLGGRISWGGYIFC